jgi:anaerobic magnesium-protoporphyrin IX monomethyl ester cyclase
MRFDKVILLNPPNPPGYVSNKDSMGGFGQLFPHGATFMPPLDLVYLASYLVEQNLSAEILECLGSRIDREAALGRIASFSAGRQSVLLLARTSAPTLDWDVDLLIQARDDNPQLHIAVYGPIVSHVSNRLEREQYIDYIIQGEPDETVFELISGMPEEEIKGLVYRQQEQWVANPERAMLKILDDLPFPKWELFPFQEYKIPRSSLRSDVTFLPMLTSRGCPVGCHYCPYPVGQGLLWRLRTPKNVVDEIERLVKDLNIQYILFRDPIFSLNQNRVIQICQEIEQRGLKFEWKCETRIDCLREDTLRAMAQAGCVGINFGVESAEVKIQENVGRKPITQQQFIQTIGLCRDLGIKTFGFFIIGLPGDTVETILSTVKFSIEMQADWVQFTAAAPFIGTQLRQWAIQHDLATEDQYAYINSYEVSMGNENLTKEQVNELADFAQKIGTYLINRKGILKEGQDGMIYRLMKSTLDWLFLNGARAYYALGSQRFKKFTSIAVEMPASQPGGK